MNKSTIGIILFSMILTAILLPRIFSLGYYVTTDENLWAIRSANFYYGLGQQDFKDNAKHPGVTAMWAGTAGFLLRFPEYRGIGVGYVNSNKYKRTLDEYGFERTDLIAAGRIFMVIANTTALGISFIYARKLIGVLPAVFGFLLIAFDPFNIAHSRLLHLDGLFSNLILLTLLAFLNFLDQKHIRDLILSGIVAGLCWLTKSPGIILAPIFSLIVVYQIYLTSRIKPLKLEAKKSFWTQNIQGYIFILVLWGIIGFATFALLWPSMWIEPLSTLSRVFFEAYRQSSGGWGGPIYFNNEVVLDGKMDPFFYPLSYLWRSTPIVILGLIFSIVEIVKKPNLFGPGKKQRVLVGLLLCVSIFLIFINLGQKKADRYLLPIYAPLDIIAALGWLATASWLSKIKNNAHQKLRMIILGFAVSIQMILALQTFPYYLSYYNPILGGGDKAPKIMMIGWGEGLDQAARYLNEKPDSNKLRVISWYGDGSFSYFFQGKTYTFSTTLDLKNAELDKILNLDYAVIYIQQRQRNIPSTLLDILDQETPENSIWINDIEYVRIYDLKKIRKN